MLLYNELCHVGRCDEICRQVDFLFPEATSSQMMTVVKVKPLVQDISVLHVLVVNVNVCQRHACR